MAVILSSTWKNRNLITHGSSPLHFQVITALIAKEACSHWNSQLFKSIKAPAMISNRWNRPPKGWIKVNSDCRFSEDSSCSGFIDRNMNGSIIFAQANEYFCTNALVAELFSIRDACIFFNQAGLDQLIFESDSLNAVVFINEPLATVHWMAKQLIHEIRRF